MEVRYPEVYRFRSLCIRRDRHLPARCARGCNSGCGPACCAVGL